MFTSRITRSPADPAGGRNTTTPRPVDPRAAHHPVRRYDSRDLFGPDAEIEITHQQGVYRLKITRQGKLILNK